jgi:hypothetical protein
LMLSLPRDFLRYATRCFRPITTYGGSSSSIVYLTRQKGDCRS